MQKVGILTFYWGENPGTALQAYSVLQLLKKALPGVDVQLINYMYSKNRFIFHRGFIRNPFRLPGAIKRFNLYKRFVREELQVKNTLAGGDYEATKSFIDGKYDAIVSGSDTVWQHDSPSIYKFPFPNIYWLPASVPAKKIAFSVSSGASVLKNYPVEYHAMLKESLNDLDLIGYRDTITKELINEIGLEDGAKALRAPDPTFLYEIKKTAVEKKLGDAGIDLAKPVVGVSGLPRNISMHVYNFYHARGFQVVSLGYNKHCDVSLCCLHPFEWAEIFRFFSLCVTDRFHGTIFALKNKTPVVAVDVAKFRFTGAGESKTKSLLKDFGLEESNHFNVNEVDSDKEGFLERLETVRNGFDAGRVEESLKDQQEKLKRFLERVTDCLDTCEKSQGY